MVLIIRTTAFWYVMPCIFVYCCQHFGETCYFLLQSRGLITSHLTSAIFLKTLIVTAYIVTLKMEGTDFSEMLVLCMKLHNGLFHLKRMLIFVKEVRSCSMNRKTTAEDSKEINRIF